MPKVVGHVFHGVDAEGVDAHLLDPVAVRVAEGLADRRVLGVQVVEIGELVVQLLVGVGVVGDGRRPVIDGRGPLHRIGCVVLVEGCLLRLRAGNRLRVLHEPRRDVARVVARVGEEIPHVVGDDVLDEVHAALVELGAERPVGVERPEVLVHLLQVARPVAVMAARLLQRVPPLVGDRRGDPDRCHTHSLDVVELVDHPLQVAAGVLRTVSGVELAHPLVVVALVPVGEPVGHHEVDDLFLPDRRGDVELLVVLGGRGACQPGHRDQGAPRDNQRAGDRGHAGLRGSTDADDLRRVRGRTPGTLDPLDQRLAGEA